MSYIVKVEPVPDNPNYRSRLVIKDSSGRREYWDGGEPEDRYFARDWNWVAEELRTAYEQGKRDSTATTMNQKDKSK